MPINSNFADVSNIVKLTFEPLDVLDKELKN